MNATSFYYPPAIGRYIPPPARKGRTTRNSEAAEEAPPQFAAAAVAILEEVDREFSAARSAAPQPDKVH